jgi:hypothetical protein
LPPVDFDDGDQFAVASLEFRIAIDADFFEFEAKFSAEFGQSRARAFAEVATLGPI